MLASGRTGAMDANGSRRSPRERKAWSGIDDAATYDGCLSLPQTLVPVTQQR